MTARALPGWTLQATQRKRDGESPLARLPLGARSAPRPDPTPALGAAAAAGVGSGAIACATALAWVCGGPCAAADALTTLHDGWPEAVSRRTGIEQRTPLHLLCANPQLRAAAQLQALGIPRADRPPTSSNSLDARPYTRRALATPDRSGALPLHLLCQVSCRPTPRFSTRPPLVAGGSLGGARACHETKVGTDGAEYLRANQRAPPRRGLAATAGQRLPLGPGLRGHMGSPPRALPRGDAERLVRDADDAAVGRASGLCTRSPWSDALAAPGGERLRKCRAVAGTSGPSTGSHQHERVRERDLGSRYTYHRKPLVHSVLIVCAMRQLQVSKAGERARVRIVIPYAPTYEGLHCFVTHP
jgi:hypothetical protein